MGDRNLAGRDRVPDHAAYQTTRKRIVELATRTPETAATVVPSCPEWTVRDLVEHLTGNCLGMTRESLGAAGLPLGELLARWEESAQRVERLAEGTDLGIGRLVMDAFTHELDLCDALGADPLEDHPAYPAAFEVVVGGLSWSITSRGLPALGLATDGMGWVAGPGAPAATVRAPRYPLYRSLSGRRSAAQIAGLDWSADPGPWLPAFFWGPFTEPA